MILVAAASRRESTARGSQEPSFNPFQTETKGKGKGKGKTKTKYWGNRAYQWKRQYGGGWFWEWL